MSILDNIHLEPDNEGVRVRYRIDGALTDVARLRLLAIEPGMLTMRRGALDKVAGGPTSLEEMARAVV